MNPFTPLGAVRHWASEDPDKLLLTFVSIENDALVEVNRTAGELLDNARLLAAALADSGMKQGDRWALVMQNHPEFVEAMLASEILGTIFVPIDLRVQPERLAFMVGHTECRGALVSRKGLDRIQALDTWPEPLEWIWVIDDSHNRLPISATLLSQTLRRVDKEKAHSLPAQPRALAEPMQMLFTSGTTGDPKAILSSYQRFASVGAMHSLLGITAEDRPYTGLSLTHANAQLISLGYSLALGLPLVVSRTFTKSRLWEIVSRYKCTTFNLLGGMATALYSEPEGPFDQQHSIRFVLSAGMPEAMWKDFERRFNVGIFEFYGTAEGGLTLNPPGIGPVGSIGKPLPGTYCEILNEQDQPLPPYKVGEICFRNQDEKADPVNYFKNPEASKTKTRGDWFRSGDHGYKDEDGWLYFSYREGDAVRRNGEFILVEDIMTTLARHPEINDVYVYGLPLAHNSPGEKSVIATVVATGLNESSIAEFITTTKRMIGQSPYPDYFQILERIPKTASEKPIDRVLIQNLRDGAGTIFSRSGTRVDRIDTKSE